MSCSVVTRIAVGLVDDSWMRILFYTLTGKGAELFDVVDMRYRTTHAKKQIRNHIRSECAWTGRLPWTALRKDLVANDGLPKIKITHLTLDGKYIEKGLEERDYTITPRVQREQEARQ